MIQSKEISKEDKIDIPEEIQRTVQERIEYAKAIPETMLDWDSHSINLFSDMSLKKFDASKFDGVIKVQEDALVIQKRLRGEWN